MRCARCGGRANHSPDLRKAVARAPCVGNPSGLERRSLVGAAFRTPVDAPRADRTMMRNDSGISPRRIIRRMSVVCRAALACMRSLARSVLSNVRARAGNSGGRRVRIARPLRLCTIGCTLALSGCGAPGPEYPQSRSEPLNAVAASPLNSVAQMCRPERALLTPQHAPDCGFGWSNLKTVDPDQWARLKVESERKCYQNAEKIARERLRLLQAAVTCEAVASRQ
jgi:hypothetical protein